MSNNNHQNGFTLIELLVTLTIVGTLTTIAYNLYKRTSDTLTCQNVISDVQQSARVAIDIISRDLQMIGFDAKKESEYYGECPVSPECPVLKDIDDIETSDKISFQYRNDSVADPNNKYRKYVYWLDGTDLKKKTIEWVEPSESVNSCYCGSGSTRIIAENVTDFTLAYYDGDAQPFTDTDSIRLIKVSITMKGEKGCTQNKSIKLSTIVVPRNVGIESVITDTRAPNCPTGLALTDPKKCGSLDLTWAPNDSLEVVTGYNIYYGPSSGNYTTEIDAGNITSTTLSGLEDGGTYYVKVTAYDESGNESPLESCEIEKALTITADNPGKPMGLDAWASNLKVGATVTLDWTSNDVNYSTNAAHDGGIGPDTDVSKYEIWRKKSSEDDTAWVLKGTALGASANSYTDSLEESDKCTTFDYKIRAVTLCGENTFTSAFSEKVFGDGAISSEIDLPIDGLTSTTPSDNIHPAAPTGPGPEGAVLSKAGYKRTFINWNNSPDEDLESLIIRYNNSPVYPVDSSAGTGVENGNNGKFTALPSTVGESFTHYGPPGCLTDPACLEIGDTYAYSLFSVDRCDNESAAAQTAQTVVNQCGEEPFGPSSGAPSTPLNFKIEACNSYTFTWDRIDDTYDTGEYDLAGYYLYSRSIDGGSTYTKVNPDLILNPPSGLVSKTVMGINPDSNSDFTGKRYLYKVYSIDCVRETFYGQDPAAATTSPHPIKAGGVPSDAITVTPGKVTFENNETVTTGDLVDPEGSPAFGPLVKALNHNSVKFNIENSSFGPVEWSGAVISWDNSSAYLKAIYRTDSSPEEIIWGTTTSVESGTAISLTPFRVAGSGGLEENTKIPLRFIFTDSDGVVGIEQDMRQKIITFSDIEYKKIFYESSGELITSCIETSITEKVVIPFNPQLTDTLQDRPINSTLPWPVPGPGGDQNPGEIVVDHYSPVNIFTYLSLNIEPGQPYTKLYYAVTDQNVTTAPTGEEEYSSLTMFTMPDNGTSVALFNGSGIDNRITAEPGDRIWYYIVVDDGTGSFDRDPEITVGTYSYDIADIENP